MTERQQHRRSRSRIDHRDETGGYWFRATCTCGWVSEPIGPAHVVTAWESHVDLSRDEGRRLLTGEPAAAKFAIEVVDDGDPPRVRIAGEVDLAAQAALLRALEPFCTAGGRTTHLELAGVTFIDSMGLGALVTAQGWANAAGGEMVLVEPSAQVQRLIATAGLTDHFNVRD